MIDKKIKKYLNELMATIPSKDLKVSNDRKDMEILRTAIIAEFDAINLYEQLAEAATNKDVKELLLDIANEEKVHIGEFEAVLEFLDKEHEPNEDKGEDEVVDLLGDEYED